MPSGGALTSRGKTASMLLTVTHVEAGRVTGLTIDESSNIIENQINFNNTNISDLQLINENHKLNTGDKLIYQNINTNITNLINNTKYYIYTVDQNKIKLYINKLMSIATGSDNDGSCIN